ncbi:AbrB family transcriptional regulator, partial [Candidatus Sumerlaeota bacterium]|nr:AbrB family transcriptional regulator [Candidatus Sumerlaeota bacterium]
LSGVSAGGAGLVSFRRVWGYDAVTAYFAAMPGGLTEMTLVGAEMGGDGRVISLTHATRVLLVVLALPFAFQLLIGYDPASRPAAGLPLDLIDVPFKTLDYVPALGNVTTTVYEIVAGEVTMLLTLPYWVWSPWRLDWVGNPMFLTSFFWTEKSDRVTNAVLMGKDSVYRFWGVGIDVVREELREGIKNLMPGEDIFEWAENIDERLAALVDRAEELESEGGRYIYGGSRIGDNERVSWEYFPFFRKMFPQTTAAE